MGLVVLAFPCNQFGGQEPGTAEDIKATAHSNGVTFSDSFVLFEKGDVNGANTRPLFGFLKSSLSGFMGDGIKWNFTKFLVDSEGKAFKRYGSTTSPSSMEGDIKELLKQVKHPPGKAKL